MDYKTGSINEDKCLKDLKKYVTNHSQDFEHFEWLLDEAFLLHFVRGKKYNSDKCTRAFKQYFHIRKNQYKAFFLEMNPQSDVGLRKGTVNVLKGRDDKERVIVLVKMANWSEDINVDQLTQSILLIMEEAWNIKNVEIEGMQIVADMSEFGWHHFKMLTPLAVYKCVNIFWNNMPIRYKSIHVINSGSLFELLLKGIKSFLPSTLRQRLIIHPPDFSELHESIMPNILPTSFGGELTEEEAYDIDLVERIYSKGEYYQRFVASLK